MATDPLVTAAAEAIEDAAITRIGRDLGTVHRDTIVAAGVAAALRGMADIIDRGPTFPPSPSVISALVRERADDIDPVPPTCEVCEQPCAGGVDRSAGYGDQPQQICADRVACNRAWFKQQGQDEAGAVTK